MKAVELNRMFAKYGYGESCVVTFEKAPARNQWETRTRYYVIKDGDVMGVVYKSERTWERRSAGARYVNARTQLSGRA